MKTPPRGLAIDISSSVRRLSVSRARIREAAISTFRAERVKDAMLSITFVGRAAISQLNRRYLGHEGPTDVISFGLRRVGRRGAVVGDVYICAEVARENAKRRGISAGEELLRLVVHGTLHVLGRDHPTGAMRTTSSMWRRQEKILARIL
ncbi:MAG TPA: rRNA maturation RNase YbeY [Gemmatimonadaceae bacterium]|jgi:probable rRNA maturation factor|nr:rRNA maturation RNase YbeY [Gemmatimonadaceae bacterium]